MSKIQVSEIKVDSELNVLKVSESESITGGMLVNVNTPDINIDLNVGVITAPNTGVIVQNSFGSGGNDAGLGQFGSIGLFQ